mgnify:CR=1 FL=1
MKTVLIWGFYNQGNIGDDLMAMLFYEMLEEAGARPVVFTSNPRFHTMGYRTTADYSGLVLDGLFLGGGAFFKRSADSNSAIEREVGRLASFISEKEVPIFGMSLGSDGISEIGAMSAARQAVVQSPHFRKTALRLGQDMELGLPNSQYLPDVVLLSGFCSDKYSRLRPVDPSLQAPGTLINLSRRSAPYLPKELWRARGQRPAFFRAHTGSRKTGGEITLPGIRVIDSDRMDSQLGYLKNANKIVSSKLHPGVIALSFGRAFEPVAPRPKTQAFLAETRIDQLVFADLFDQYMSFIRSILS